MARPIPLGALSELCRALRHNLSAGLSVVRVFQQQGERGPRPVRPYATKIGIALQTGKSVGAAVDSQGNAFPPLFRALTRVGEETGHLPEICGELEKYYTLQQKLKRQFRSQTTLPILQFFFAILIISGLIFILGFIAHMNNQKPIALLGLAGTPGALTFLVCGLGVMIGPWALYQFVLPQLRFKYIVDQMLLKVPILGPCMEALALGRFALAAHLTMDSGISIAKAVRLSFQATGNAAFTHAGERVTPLFTRGASLGDALEAGKIFPTEFLNIVHSAEEAGKIPEAMRHQAEYYDEEAARRMTALTRAAGFLVWLTYAGCMIVAIFSVAKIYLNLLDSVK